jgi:FkbM family methyltransferase
MKKIIKRCYAFIRDKIIFMARFGLKRGLVLILQFSTKHTGKIKVPGIKYPFRLRSGTSDIRVFHQIFVQGEYSFLKSLNSKEQKTIIIDGGANIGLFTVFVKKYYPDAKIICIEPDIENFEILKQNVAPYSDVYCENCGLWDKNIRLKIYDKYSSGKWGMTVEEDEFNGTVKAVSMNSLFEKYDIQECSILKLDIETSEKQVFSTDYENWMTKVNMIVIELHDWKGEMCAKPFFEAVSRCFGDYTFSICGENIILEKIKK